MPSHDERKRRAAVAGKLLAHLGTDVFGTGELGFRGLLVNDLHDLLGHLARGVALLGRHADHDVGGRAEGLDEHFVGDGLEVLSNLFGVGRGRIADLHLRAAGELDRERKAVRKDPEDGDDEAHQRDQIQHMPVVHERNRLVNAENSMMLSPHQRAVFSASGRRSDRCEPSSASSGGRRSD